MDYFALGIFCAVENAALYELNDRVFFERSHRIGLVFYDHAIGISGGNRVVAEPNLISGSGERKSFEIASIGRLAVRIPKNLLGLRKSVDVSFFGKMRVRIARPSVTEQKKRKTKQSLHWVSPSLTKSNLGCNAAEHQFNVSSSKAFIQLSPVGRQHREPSQNDRSIARLRHGTFGYMTVSKSFLGGR